MFHIPKLCLTGLLINTFIAVLLTKSSISMRNYLKAIILIILFFKRHKPKKQLLQRKCPNDILGNGRNFLSDSTKRAYIKSG